MELPIQLNFFKKLELYQELKSHDSRVGGDKAWSGEKDILRWAATKHRHLGTAIGDKFVKENILTDTSKYNNFPDDALRSMENLCQRGWAEYNSGLLWFLPEGLLMGEVIDEVARGEGWRYEFFYWFTWITVICGALLVIAPVVRYLLSFVLSAMHWFFRIMYF